MQSESTSNRLAQYLTKFKQKKVNFSKQIEQSTENNNMYRHASLELLNRQKFVDKQKQKKEKQLKLLKNHIRNKIGYDIQSQLLIKKLEQTNEKRRQQLQKRLTEVQKRNIIRLKEVQSFQRYKIKKISEQLQKNKSKQGKLKLDYEKLSKQEGKLKITKQLQMNFQKEEWKKLINQKYDLQNLLLSHRKKQQKIIMQKNPQQLIAISQEQFLKPQKQKIKKLNLHKKRQKGDLKQIGRQYLDFAKKMRTSPLTKEAKMKNQNYLNINLKVANYGHDMMDRIYNNSNNLSKNISDTTNQRFNRIELITMSNIQEEQCQQYGSDQQSNRQNKSQKGNNEQERPTKKNRYMNGKQVNEMKNERRTDNGQENKKKKQNIQQQNQFIVFQRENDNYLKDIQEKLKELQQKKNFYTKVKVLKANKNIM